ncbi:MFS transporter [Variovorax rhizosphaerae]|uniref:MFS transporter n=1 Tax=Variovorax rhizosphaerae TaxID=1836200 RepID=A0ABU8WUK5_9BURK
MQPAVMRNTTGVVDSATSEAIYRKVSLRLIPFFCLCYFAAYLDRINVGIAKLQMLDQLKFSDTVYGLGAGLFFIGYILLEVPSNIILSRVGARIWLGRIMVTWGLLSAATMLVQTPTQFYLVRFLLGAAEAGFLPGILYYLTLWYPARRRGRIFGLFLVGLPLASVLGGPLSGWIMTAFHGVNGWAGWQWLFLLEAIPSVVLGVALFMVLPNNIRSARWLNDSERNHLEAELKKHAEPEQKHDAMQAFRDPKIWLLGFIDMTIAVATYIVSFWLPSMLKEAGAGSAFTIGWMTAIPSVAAIVLMLVVSASSDRRKERWGHLTVTLVITGIALIATAQSTHSLVLSLVLLTVANAFAFASFPVFWCLPSLFLSGTAAAAGIALINSIANLGGFAATFVVGWIKDATGSQATGLMLFGGLLLVSAIATFLLRGVEQRARAIQPLPSVQPG